MNDKSPLELLHAYHDAWEQGDVDKGVSFYAPDIVVHMGGASPLAGEYRGRDEFVAQWIERVAQYTDSWIVRGNDILLVGDDGIVLMVHEYWSRGSRSVETDRLGIYLFKDNMISECWFSDMDQAAVDDFFSDIGPKST